MNAGSRQQPICIDRQDTLKVKMDGYESACPCYDDRWILFCLVCDEFSTCFYGTSSSSSH